MLKRVRIYLKYDITFLTCLRARIRMMMCIAISHDETKVNYIFNLQKFAGLNYFLKSRGDLNRPNRPQPPLR